MAGRLGFELLWAPQHPPPPKVAWGPALNGPLGFSLVSFMDNEALVFSRLPGDVYDLFISRTMLREKKEMFYLTTHSAILFTVVCCRNIKEETRSCQFIQLWPVPVPVTGVRCNILL